MIGLLVSRQLFITNTPLRFVVRRSVGVVNGERTYAYPVIIRAVNSVDAMTATIERIPYKVLEKITKRITAEVPNVNRVLYDLTPKPSGTIEWE